MCLIALVLHWLGSQMHKPWFACKLYYLHLIYEDTNGPLLLDVFIYYTIKFLWENLFGRVIKFSCVKKWLQTSCICTFQICELGCGNHLVSWYNQWGCVPMEALVLNMGWDLHGHDLMIVTFYSVAPMFSGNVYTYKIVKTFDALKQMVMMWALHGHDLMIMAICLMACL